MRKYLYISLIIFFIVNTANAGSVLSSSGLGLPFNYASADAMGMGGVGIAVPNSMSPSRVNPAGLFPIETTRFAVEYYYENNKYKDNTDKAGSSYSNLGGFSFAVPIGKTIILSLGLSPITKMDYDLSFQNEVGGETYLKTIEGSGGLNATSLSISYHPINVLALGLQGDFIFGKFSETWNINYENWLFDATVTDFTTLNRGYSWTAGLMLMPTSKWILGAVFSPQINIDNTTEAISFNQSNSGILILEEYDGSIDYPSCWGIGLTYTPRTNFMISTDYKQTNWDQVKVNESKIPRIQSTGEYAIGLEWQPSTDNYDLFLKRFAYRLGANFKPLYILDANGNEIVEQNITLGFGIPIMNLNSRIQLAFSYGKRGSLKENGISENLFRIHASIAGGEKWFIRTY